MARGVVPLIYSAVGHHRVIFWGGDFGGPKKLEKPKNPKNPKKGREGKKT
jgi:hypothetical protein